jgi:hypothetical protein
MLRVATVTDFLGSARDWHTRHCEPIVQALYENDGARARAALAGCRAALQAEGQLSPDARRSLDYILLDFELSIADAFGPPEQAGEHFRRTYAALAQLPPAGPESDAVQAKQLIDMLGTGARRGFVTASEAEMDRLLARIPLAYQTPNVWYYVTAWAFHHGNLKYLEQALERQTLETTGWLDDYYWLRTNLMYLLVDGRATPLDVEKTLRGYRHPLQLQDFRLLLLPRCAAAGLLDAGLYALLEQRERELAPLHGTYPARNPRTARTVKQG